MKKLLLIACLMVLVGVSGCGSKYMQPADPAIAQSHPGQDESKIVFLRASSFGGAVQSWVCEEKDGKLEYVTVISSGAKVAHTTTPGKHMYLTGAENSELMEANLEGGRTYYTYISPRMGMWKARFLFVPVTKEKLTASDFKKDFAWCDWMESNADGSIWFNSNLPSLNSKYAEAMEDYMKNPADRKILNPEDGSLVPIF